jgi:fatty-acid desaturase
MLSSYLILIHQIIAHIALISLIIYFPMKYWLITTLVYSILYCFGGTITYHRLLSHKSFRAPLWFYYLGSVIGTLSCSGSPIAWVATHKKHHRFTDQKNDPHSMRFMPWYKVQWLTMLVPAEPKYAAHLLRSKFQIFLHKYYFAIHATYAAALYLINPELIIYMYLAPAALVWEAGSIINTVCHKWGYKNYDIPDDSKNNKLIAFFTFGEGLHNNHHAKQSLFNFDRKSGEIDVASFFIKHIKQRSA